uniref:Uncharacterized protein n=1 Tax=Arundo donax TaxID=35708 RepID=A0A0A9CK93_ARUDO
MRRQRQPLRVSSQYHASYADLGMSNGEREKQKMGQGQQKICGEQQHEFRDQGEPLLRVVDEKVLLEKPYSYVTNLV